MKITFDHTGYTKQGRKYNQGTHEVSEADYVYFKPYSADADAKEDVQIGIAAKPDAVEEPRRRGRKPKQTD